MCSNIDHITLWYCSILLLSRSSLIFVVISGFSAVLKMPKLNAPVTITANNPLQFVWLCFYADVTNYKYLSFLRSFNISRKSLTVTSKKSSDTSSGKTRENINRGTTSSQTLLGLRWCNYRNIQQALHFDIAAFQNRDWMNLFTNSIVVYPEKKTTF